MPFEVPSIRGANRFTIWKTETKGRNAKKAARFLPSHFIFFSCCISKDSIGVQLLRVAHSSLYREQSPRGHLSFFHFSGSRPPAILFFF